MDFDWAAWHKKFEDFGISTHSTSDAEPKFPGSFPEPDKATNGTDAGGEFSTRVPQGDLGDSSTAPNSSKQNTSGRGWREEMEEEESDPVWQKHLDKLQKSGKLKERNEEYAPPRENTRGDDGSTAEEEPEFLTFTYDQLQVSAGFSLSIVALV